MLEDDFRNTAYQDYTATMLKMLTEAFIRFSGCHWEAPSFIDIVYPETRKEESSEQIISHVLSLFQ